MLFEVFDVGFTNQNSVLLEIQGMINLTLVINDMDIPLNPQIKFLSKAMHFYPLENMGSKYEQKLRDTTKNVNRCL